METNKLNAFDDDDGDGEMRQTKRFKSFHLLTLTFYIYDTHCCCCAKSWISERARHKSESEQGQSTGGAARVYE